VPSDAPASQLNNATSIAGTSSQGAARIQPIASGNRATPKMGRGGAGNFFWENEQERLEEVEKKEREEAIQQDILKHVDSGLARPGRAVLKHEYAKE
jgi:hypothetical protein